MAEKKSPPRKLLKLNPNGKLLSSPPARRFEEKSHNKPEGKRKSALEKKTKTKVVAIKYIGGNRSKETLGKTIDDILNGALKYVPLRQVVTATNTGPPKPTHPFFVKNAAQKPVQVLPLMSHTSENIGKSDQPHEQRSDIFKPARADSQFSRSIFPKQPDLIASLWPPKDLLHLRDSGPWRSSDDTGSILPGQRKDKESVVRVDDSENILLIELKHSGSSSHGSDTPVLRVPTRYVASGQTFQKGMESQLSQTVRSEFAANGKPSKIHPSVFKFYNLITTSQSALDEGSFDTTQWTQKYAPTNAEEVLQPGPEVRMLRDWLRNLMVSSVDTGKSSTDKQKRLENRKAKRRKAADKLDGFIVSSEDEASEMDELSDPDNDELAGDVTVSSKRTVIRVGDSVGKFQSKEKGRMTNAVLISGPNGCGKSASVYAVAKELDFEVFEVNSGNRRSAKDILERVGDMTQNHLVHHLDSKDEMGEDSNDDIQPAQLGPIDTAKQSTMNSFYKSATQSSSKQGQKKKKNQRKDQRPANSAASTFSRPQKQSLILLEEADILFEEDKQFWTGVLALISQSKRPVIITCSFEELIPLQDLSLHAILRYRPPPVDLAVDYMLVIAANEGHMLDREAVRDLYSVSNHDLRKSLMELDFWCQMGVGSKKCGIDWILDRWPKGSDVDAKGDTLRVISLQTYQRFMGWFNRDILVGNNEFEEEMELQLEGLNWWQLDNDDTDNGNLWEAWVSDNSGNSHVEQASKETSFHKLQRAAELADNQSVIDILSPTWSLRQEEVS
jgi:sorting nexin-8